MDKRIIYQSCCKGCDWRSEETEDLNKVHEAEDQHEKETGHYRQRVFRTLFCVCGKAVGLDGFTNECECGRDYNSSGQLLAPRSQWGEETGEHPADILRIK